MVMPSQRQMEVLCAIDAWTELRGHPPTSRELGAVLEVSPARIHEMEKDLRTRGWLAREHGRSRALAVIALPVSARALRQLYAFRVGMPDVITTDGGVVMGRVRPRRHAVMHLETEVAS